MTNANGLVIRTAGNGARDGERWEQKGPYKLILKKGIGKDART